MSMHRQPVCLPRRLAQVDPATIHWL